MYHPDKMQNTSASDDRSIFLKIQEAFNTLLDEKKRRAYDSQLDFDESVPTLTEMKKYSKAGAAEFCAVVGEVFMRNARFAMIRPVPEIGNANTPIAQVNQFYDYWIKFDSWRDFTNVDCEHNPDSATSREEKRWMIKENERNAKKLKKKEMGRITDFVMMAMEYDPRMIEDKEIKRLQKEALKIAKEKELAKALEDEKEAKRLQQLAWETEKDNAKAMKLERERIKKLESRIRSTFRKLMVAAHASCEGSPNIVNRLGINSPTPSLHDDIEYLCTTLEPEVLNNLNESLGGENAIKDATFLKIDGLEIVNQKLMEQKNIELIAIEEENKLKEQRKKDIEAKARANDRRKKGLDRELTRDEISALSKALGKFPAGTRNRWECISKAMNETLNPEFPFTPDECTRSAHNAMQFLANIKLNEKTPLATLQAQAADAISKLIVENTSGTIPSTTTDTVVTSEPVPATKESTNVTATTKTSEEESSSSTTEWTQQQQKQLEAGLVKYPATMDKAERWTKIASEVTGKTKKDCIERYKEIRAEVQAKRAGGK
jgi:DnaJ family protein C protein 2